MTKTYITTAIPYVNGKPHVGHAMDYLLSDVYFRYMSKKGEEVRFQSGTDEHGNKIFNKAKDQGISVEDYVKENSDNFKNFIERLNVHPTDFIRTTNKDHERRCQEIWKKLENHIYSAEYEGWYCEGCERFVTEKEVEENAGICPDHQKPYEKLAEKNFYLRISDFKDDIKKAIESDGMRILPEFRKKEILNLLDDTPDVSISRPKKNLSWGIEVPGDDSQVMYVWIDALSNYITLLGYPENDISEWWPASVQFVGKDILRFHAIIWPAMLLGLGLPLPKAIFSHGFINVDGQKMAKSIGNVVDPIEILDKHGTDACRYYFLRHVDNFVDSDFTWEKFEAAYNGELANDLGNLVQRLATLCKKNNLNYAVKETDFSPAYVDAMDSWNFNAAFEHVWGHIHDLNKKIDEEKPWELAKNGETEKLEAFLTECVDKILHSALELSLFIPETAEKIEKIFKNSSILPPETPLFPKER